ncbi:actin-domain-containing protein [Protomyces lactucae-debilis]|uniref:Actin-domain-containing protein n=1 Tax=Protomyces lactucae-debilis TaxID=2754530 RepID=A0A1Y2FKB2_PROLT|nr:actin-domain-containing protein [Protomyces lactucae-debilis]ORY84413.1 actin-domain-containing protein [Protomyces lactucae-debilis]
MPYRDHDMLVIELGSHTCRATLSLAESLAPPQHRFPTRVGVLPSGDYICSNDLEDATSSTEAESLNIIRPLVAGKVADWKALVALLSHILYTLTGKEPILQPVGNPVLVMCPPCWSPTERERLTQLFFQTFRVQAFMAADPAVASLFACSSLSGLVIDIGHEKTDVTGVFESIISHPSRQTVSQLGGRQITEHLLSLLRASPPLDQATQQSLSASEITLELAEEIKCSDICEVPLGNIQQPAATKGATEDEGVLDIAAVVASGKTREYLARAEAEKRNEGGKKQQVIPNAQLSHNTLLLKSGRTIVVDGARFKAAERVLSSNELAEAIWSTVNHPTIEASRRHELWENIVIVGLGARISGLREALLMRLQDRFASTGQLGAAPVAIYDPYGQAQAPTIGAYPTILRAIKIPVHFPEWNIREADIATGNASSKGVPEEATFLGAQIIAHIAFTDTSHSSIASRNYLDRSMYTELGPCAIHSI